ncbi:TonB family protein [Pontibacter rugosus]|uniref:TonB family protein n=1 Tax=Pontibacter rugosus TaxID=1745966 RepID=A0ABW3SKZ6_9BACT
MEKSYFLSMTFNNIVFQGRNQAYGAYTLRKAYANNITRAAILATALFSGALVVPLVENIIFADEQEKLTKHKNKVIELTGVKLPDLPPIEPEPAKSAPVAPPAPQENVATEKFVKIKVVDDQTTTTEDVPEQSLLSTKNIGTTTIEGELPAAPSIATEPPVGINGGGGTDATTSNEPYVYVEVMPEFEGGHKALMSYLGRKLKYPRQAQSAGVDGTVVVTFVVGTNGQISDVNVLKGLGFGTEEEAIRVIESMPNWKPGRQNGRTVPVRYTLPIRFSLK